MELFVVRCRVSGLADDKAISSRLGDFDLDSLGVVDAQDVFNLVSSRKLPPVIRTRRAMTSGVKPLSGVVTPAIAPLQTPVTHQVKQSCNPRANGLQG